MSTGIELSAYERWLEQEGIPVLTGYHVEDVRTVPLAPWPRLGGMGAYAKLEGAQGITGLYICEIPPGGVLNPEKHLYEEVIYGLVGSGTVTLWQDDEGPRQTLEWREGSIFSPPLNTWHQLSNSSPDHPARFMAVTNAPLVMDLFHNPEFVFRCDFVFKDRYCGEPDYFSPRIITHEHSQEPWYEVNFIEDFRTLPLPQPSASLSRGIAGFGRRHLGLSHNSLLTFINEYPARSYTKAHWHEAGFHIFIASGQGYTLMWPRELGLHPFSQGHGDKVVRVDWREGSVEVPPSGWFHQHFNLSDKPSRYVPTGPAGRRYPMAFLNALRGGSWFHPLLSVKEGGNQIDYDMEDPLIRKMYEEELSRVRSQRE